MATVTFGSFPRSGNFFLVDVLRKHASSVGVHWVGHNAHLLTKHSDSFTVIRNPLHCVPSWVVYKGDTRTDRAERVLQWYCAYHTKCYDYGIRTFAFDDLISNPVGLISQVCDVQSYQTDYRYFCNETVDRSLFPTIVDEMREAPSFDDAVNLFEALCVPVG
ncbi:hypothetical protein UFOVP1387_32 [uncultured Caudovirales phage]|uniref:Uncharacterized protein n=1 Tax=uncultured Caudovirales phage TaxID=2100421 RepID=A0A6J5S636_9CAUD|nr:hypothetical protein UFOVP1387_32 [uncultured Caudovirales phage]